ncbi:MAG TPA: acyl-CoA dehydrogenase, partial [Myxococcota bacterium]|nr:acyl-CoA dehydrogenase [Myxococcota bacterium]
MAIDFSLPADIVELRTRIREFIDKDVEPAAAVLEKTDDRAKWGPEIIRLRKLAREKGLWLP